MKVWGNLAAFLERLDDEWNGSLKVGQGSPAGDRGRCWQGVHICCSLYYGDGAAELHCGALVGANLPQESSQKHGHLPHRPASCHLAPLPPQVLDPHANEYMERLKDEAVILALAQKASNLFKRQSMGARWTVKQARPGRGNL